MRSVRPEGMADATHTLQLRAMRAWVNAQVPFTSAEGPRVRMALTYSEALDLVESQYHQGIRGFLADSALV